MKIKFLINVILFAVLVSGNTCGVDPQGQPYILNYSTIASRSLKEVNFQKRDAKGLQSQKRGQRRFPLYVDTAAGLVFNAWLTSFDTASKATPYQILCRPASMGLVSHETQKIMDVLADDTKPDNVLLTGQPELDTDLRVFSLAERVLPLSGCSDIPQKIAGLDIVSVNFAKLQSDFAKLTPAEYNQFIDQQIMSVHGGKNIFYLRNFSSLLGRANVDAEALLDLFLNHGTPMLLHVDSPAMKAIFDKNSMRPRVTRVRLSALNVSEIKDYLSGLFQAENFVFQSKLDPSKLGATDLTQDLARLSVAYGKASVETSNKKPFELAVYVWERLVENSGSLSSVQIKEEMLDLLAEETGISVVALANSDVLTRVGGLFAMSDDTIDALVAQNPNRFIEQFSQEDMAKRIKKTLKLDFDAIRLAVKSLEGKVDASRKALADKIAESTERVINTIEDVEVSPSEEAVVRRIVERTSYIVSELKEKMDQQQYSLFQKVTGIQEDINNKTAEAVRGSKNALLAKMDKILGAQGELFTLVDTLEGTVEETRDNLIADLLKAQRAIVAHVDDSAAGTIWSLGEVQSKLISQMGLVKGEVKDEVADVLRPLVASQTLLAENQTKLGGSLDNLLTAQAELVVAVESVDRELKSPFSVIVGSLGKAQREILSSIDASSSDTARAMGNIQAKLAAEINDVGTKVDATKTEILQRLAGVQLALSSQQSTIAIETRDLLTDVQGSLATELTRLTEKNAEFQRQATLSLSSILKSLVGDPPDLSLLDKPALLSFKTLTETLTRVDLKLPEELEAKLKALKDFTDSFPAFKAEVERAAAVMEAEIEKIKNPPTVPTLPAEELLTSCPEKHAPASVIASLINAENNPDRDISSSIAISLSQASAEEVSCYLVRSDSRLWSALVGEPVGEEVELKLNGVTVKVVILGNY